MPDTNIGSTDTSNLSNVVNDFEVDSVSLDNAKDQKETTWQNANWRQYVGYYKTIPELQAAIDAKATWTVGKGFQADSATTFTLNNIKGFGKDTFNTLIENMIRTYHINGDSFAEIIRNKRNEFINLKPLNAGDIKIVANRKGLIIRYENTTKFTKKKAIKFQPKEILHFSRNRLADEIHGVSLIPAVEDIILMRNEAMSDQKQLMHRHVRPRIVYNLDTDDPTQIALFKAKADLAVENGENIYLPKGTVEHEVLSVPTNATLNPLPWINQLNQYFFQAVGVPQIVVGGSNEITEATAKILYLAFQQTIEEEQLYVEEQIGLQLGLKVEYEFPASLENEMLSDKAKGETTQASTPEDTSVKGVGVNG